MKWIKEMTDIRNLWQFYLLFVTSKKSVKLFEMNWEFFPSYSSHIWEIGTCDVWKTQYITLKDWNKLFIFDLTKTTLCLE